ncbi:hypothetical protein D9M71_586480 [compost metagenome]
MRFQGFLVARDAHRADLGAGDQAEHAVEHADAGAQDRHHGDLLAGDLLHLHRAGPAFDLVAFQRQVLGRLVGQQGADFLGQLAKILGADVMATHQADLVTDQGMTNLEDGHGMGSPAGWKKSAVA